jgi:predicted RNase H-like nuclease
VFPAPARVLLDAPTFAAANALALEQGCPGVSQQTYGLRTAILQVAPLARRDPRIHEVHPEVSFSLAGGGALATRKSSWNGMRERCRILKEHGLAVPDQLPDAGKAGVADVLDAVAYAWSAWRVATDRAVAFPADGDADTPVIWG